MPELVPVDHDPFASAVQFMPVDHDPWASAPFPIFTGAVSLIDRPSGAAQWQSAIEAQRQRNVLAPSMGEQVMDIAGRTASIPWNALMTGPRLMGDVMEGRIDPNSPEVIKRAVDTALSVTGMGMFGAERGALGMAGGYARPRGYWEDNVSKIRDLNDKGMSQQAIAQELGVSRPRMNVLMKRYGIESNFGPGATENIELSAKIQKLQDQGLGPTEIGKQLGMTRNAVSMKMRRMRDSTPDWFKEEMRDDQPLARTVLTRDASGRPLQTQPFRMENEDAVLEAGAARYGLMPVNHDPYAKQ